MDDQFVTSAAEVPPGRAPTPEPSEDAARDRLSQALTALAGVQLELEQERRSRLETQALFDLVLGAMSDAVVLVDTQGRVSRVNQAAAELTGRSPEDLHGRPVTDALGPGVPATPWQVFERSPRGHLAFEAKVPAPDGRLLPVSVSCSLLRDPTGKVLGAVYAARDLSETQHLVHQLGQAEARWRLLAELGDLLGRQLDPNESLEETCRWLARATNSGVAVILVTGLTVERAVGWPPEGTVAEHLASLEARPLERGSALWTAVQASRTVHAPTLQPDFPLLRRDGAPEGVRSAVLVPLVARSTSLGALLVHTSEPDGIRQRALVEQAAARVALALANAQLREALSHFEASQEAARFREELMAAVSPAMQTPLAVMLGSIKALEVGGDLGARDRARLYERMSRRGAQLRRLVQQFLDYSRLEAGRPIVVRPTLADVGAAIVQAEADVGERRPVHVDVPAGLPPAFVDVDRLDQVLTNLISNAIKFSPPGSPISIAARAGTDTVEVTVADQGRGMSPADLACVFEKYHRGAGADGTPGTGLGLYVSQAVLQAQGGRIVASSRLGEGSRFTVVLPRHPPAAAQGVGATGAVAPASETSR